MLSIDITYSKYNDCKRMLLGVVKYKCHSMSIWLYPGSVDASKLELAQTNIFKICLNPPLEPVYLLSEVSEIHV